MSGNPSADTATDLDAEGDDPLSPWHRCDDTGPNHARLLAFV